jgi:hypothetical protein
VYCFNLSYLFYGEIGGSTKKAAKKEKKEKAGFAAKTTLALKLAWRNKIINSVQFHWLP